MKCIVFTGDSHTCGQGSDGWETQFEGYNPLGTGVNDGNYSNCNSYVNRVRDYVMQTTGTIYRQYKADEITQQANIIKDKMVAVSSCGYIMDVDADAVFVMFAESDDTAKANIVLNGEEDKAVNIVLHTGIPRHGKYSYRIVPLFMDGIKQVKINAVEGSVLFKQIETFKGKYSCVNAAVGSCPAGRFLKDYYPSCVEVFSPSIVVAEAHTINDWIATESPESYESDLTSLLNKCGERGAHVIMTTVSPILGDQKWADKGYLYSDYIESSKKAAQRAGVILADSWEIMERRLEELSEEEKNSLMFSDNWHVNALGHKIYAEAIIEKLKPLL